MTLPEVMQHASHQPAPRTWRRPAGHVASAIVCQTRRGGRARRAFTLIELLTVAAVMGVLILLLLPALQFAREAARKTVCTQNLHQLAIALQQYEVFHGCLPAGTVADKGPIQSVSQGYHHNWLVALLPYIDRPNAAARVDARFGVYDPVNAPVRRMVMTVFRCPTDQAAPIGLGYGNYAACHDPTEVPIDVTNEGTFYLNSFLRSTDISDGMSHTIFLGEKLVSPFDLGWMSGTRATLRNMGTHINGQATNPGTLSTVSAVLDGPRRSTKVDDDQLRLPNQMNPTIPNPKQPRIVEFAVMTPSPDMTAALQPPRKIKLDARLAVGGFESWHPGGLNVLMGDGSVQFLSDGITDLVLWQLAHRRDGRLANEHLLDEARDRGRNAAPLP